MIIEGVYGGWGLDVTSIFIYFKKREYFYSTGFLLLNMAIFVLMDWLDSYTPTLIEFVLV